MKLPTKSTNLDYYTPQQDKLATRQLALKKNKECHFLTSIIILSIPNVLRTAMRGLIDHKLKSIALSHSLETSALLELNTST